MEVKVDPDKKFQQAINDAINQLDDLTDPFNQMIDEWFKGNKFIFDPGRKGPGKYKDLSEKYKKQKKRGWGFIYPILRASGHLANSMEQKGHPNSITQIVNKKSLILGTDVSTEDGKPYAQWLQTGTKKMPARPFVLIGGEQVASPMINKRRDAWIELLNDWVLQVTKKKVG